MIKIHIDRIHFPSAIIAFKQSMFPVGENYIQFEEKQDRQLIGVSEELNIEWVFNGDAEIVQLYLIVSAIRAINKNVKLHLNTPYFPGARQDRICEYGEGFGLKVYSELINSLNFESVTVFDPHSDVLGALVKNVKIIDNAEFVKKAIYEECPIIGLKEIHEKPIVLISPDAGANKKIFKLAQKLPWKNIEVIRADKIRDTKTGKITGTEVYVPPSTSLLGKTVFIPDDICSRGGTFMALAKELKINHRASKVILIVSHYEGTADINKLKESGIDKVYCFNDFGNLDPNAKSPFVVKIS